MNYNEHRPTLPEENPTSPHLAFPRQLLDCYGDLPHFYMMPYSNNNEQYSISEARIAGPR